MSCWLLPTGSIVTQFCLQGPNLYNLWIVRNYLATIVSRNNDIRGVFVLPDEENTRLGILSDFAESFRDGQHLVVSCLEVLDNIWKLTDSMGNNAASVVLGLFTKSIKQFRAILLLCEHGLTETGDGAVRSLFESVLALQFIFDDNMDWGPPIPAGVQPVDFRADLYESAPVIQMAAKVSQMNEDDRGFWDDPAAREDLRKRVEEIELLLGPEWADRLSKTKTYSGRNVRDLASRYGLDDYYLQAYSTQSQRIHANDSYTYVHIDHESKTVSPRFAPDGNEVEHVFSTGFAMLFTLLTVLSDRLDIEIQIFEGGESE